MFLCSQLSSIDSAKVSSQGPASYKRCWKHGKTVQMAGANLDPSGGPETRVFHGPMISEVEVSGSWA